MPFANHSDTFRSHDIFRFDLSDRYRRIIGAYRTPTVYGLRHTECAYYFELDRFGATFAGTNTDAIVHRQDKDFSIANLTLFAATAAFNDRVDRGLDEFVVHGDLQLDLAEQVDGDLVATISVTLALLSSKSLAVHDGEAKDLDLRQSLLDGF